MNEIIEIICEAWREKNPELLFNILADDFEWHDSPFEETITDRERLVERWNKDISAQENIVVSSDVISEGNEIVVAHWLAEFDRNNTHEILDGVFVIKTTAGKLTQFKMWWVKD